MAADLDIERRKSNLNPEEIRQFINFLSQGKTNYYSRIGEIFKKYPVLGNPSDLDFLHLDRKTRYEIHAGRFQTLASLVRAGEVDPLAEYEFFYLLLISTRSPIIGLHFGMVMPALQKLMSTQQWQKWAPLCKNFSVIFAYAQTEVAHGTWLSKVETTAEFDKSSDEFVINSNGTTGYKYWPGYLGKSCSHALVMAQLIIHKHNYGPHLFVVPIRCVKTYKPLDGVDVGDMGPTYSFYDRDNGYVGFTNVRIPRDYMLMKYQTVDEKGNYNTVGNQKLMFAAMLKVRSDLVTFSAYLVSIGAVIATRYSIIRKQCELKPGHGEVTVIDYLTQQDKLFPAICLVFALQTCHRSIMVELEKVDQEVSEDNFSRVTDSHYLLSGIKAWSSTEALKCLSILRGACGGHGYSLSSGLPPLISEADAMCTYEGDNIVMHQQCARRLVRCYFSKSKGEKQTGFMQYLDRKDSSVHLKDQSQLMDLNLLLRAYEQRSRYVLTSACKNLKYHIECNNCSQEEAWINSSLQLVNTSKAHSHLYIVAHFIAALSTSKLSNELAQVIHKVCLLFCLIGIRDNLGEFLTCGFFDQEKVQVEMILSSILSLFNDLRPHMLKLAEAFSFPDFVLNSTLGHSDGRAYERLLEWSKQSILNDDEWKSDVFQKYIKPVLEATSNLWMQWLPAIAMISRINHAWYMKHYDSVLKYSYSMDEPSNASPFSGPNFTIFVRIFM